MISINSPLGEHDRLLAELLSFVRDEREAGNQKLLNIWQRPITEKLRNGWSQDFVRIEKSDHPSVLWAYPGEGESRFREGDLLFLHGGSPLDNPLCRQISFEREEDDRWMLRSDRAVAMWDSYTGGPCYADPDSIDLTPYYERAIEEIASSRIGRDFVLPLLAGTLGIGFLESEVIAGERFALSAGFNAKQAEAVGLAYGAEQVACIQGPPGTGKTRVLSLIARLMVARGERILMTSHTHTAINNALNKIFGEGVPTVKVGRDTQSKGLDVAIATVSGLDAWEERPRSGGYVVGATPFATCNTRLENYEFDTILFDEASQVTVPLALMAMRKGKRYIFVGDHQQLPPVLQSRSILSKDSMSVFTTLTSQAAGLSVMLQETYRMNRWLTAWPSDTYYGTQLRAVGPNSERCLKLDLVEPRFAEVFDPAASAIFIPTLDSSARTRNFRDAELVVQLCQAAADGGLALSEIGIVSPYRAHGRLVRGLLAKAFGAAVARNVVADTVERMQGQERELIILSLATGDEVFLAAIAEFFFQPERLNVSITRAKTKLIVIGPEAQHIPKAHDDRIWQWIKQYREFIGQCRRVEF